MRDGYKEVLYINLRTLDYEFKTHEDLWPFIGGVGVAYKLMKDNLAEVNIVIAAGPLSGVFPYLSKTLLLYKDGNRVNEAFGGGSISALMNLSWLDAIVLFGDTRDDIKISISQRQVDITKITSNTENIDMSNIVLSAKRVVSEDYFSFGNFRKKQPELSGKIGIDIDTTESYDLKNYYDFEKIYSDILDGYRKLTVDPRNNPSCTGCPMGCDKSSLGEDDINVAVLPRCLISCAYAEDIYKSIPLVYSCLSSVGYNYRHSDLEKIPTLVGNLKTEINEIFNNKLETE